MSLRIKVSASAEAEFNFYSRTDLDMIGHSVGHSFDYDPEGHSALECWWYKDTHGKTIPCRDPLALGKAVRGKASVNLQVRMWAQDVADHALLGQRELLDYTHGWPSWVLLAVLNQATSIAVGELGFAPRFCRAEFMHGNLWLPDMDPFDPSI